MIIAQRKNEDRKTRVIVCGELRSIKINEDSIEILPLVGDYFPTQPA